MKRAEILIALAALALIALACVALGVRAYVPPDELRGQFQAVFNTFSVTAKIVIVAAGLALLLALGAGLGWLGWVAYHSGVIWKSDAEIKKAAALQARRDASLVITTAAPGSQIILSEVLDAGLHIKHWPGHLLATGLNGAYEPTAGDVSIWAHFQEKQSITRPGGRQLSPPPEQPRIEAGPPPLLPVLIQAQRLIIAGGSDSGKTTLTKHLISARAEQSKIVVIDPHSPSRLLGFDVIGAGRKYDKIAQALEALELLMDERYNDIARGVMGYFEHSAVSIFVDEWTSIVEHCPEGGRILKTLLTESRKVGMYLTVLSHSTTVDTLGVDAQIKKSALIVQLTGGNGSPRRAHVLPQHHITPDGQKARPVEYALPGPFSGQVSAADLVLELPDPQIIRVQKLVASGASLRAIARELFPNVKDPGGPYIDQVKDLLKQIEAGKKAGNSRE